MSHALKRWPWGEPSFWPFPSNVREKKLILWTGGRWDWVGASFYSSLSPSFKDSNDEAVDLTDQETKVNTDAASPPTTYRVDETGSVVRSTCSTLCSFSSFFPLSSPPDQDSPLATDPDVIGAERPGHSRQLLGRTTANCCSVC